MHPLHVMFIHGMFMTPKCWERWLPRFGARGIECSAPPWPHHDGSIGELRRRHPDPSLGKLTISQVVEQYERRIRDLPQPPVLVGHSMGGLVVQLLLQRSLGLAGVAIDSAPPRGVLTLKYSFLKSNWPMLNFFKRDRPHLMTFPQFQYAFVNSLPLEQQRTAYDEQVVPESRRVPQSTLSSQGSIDFRRGRAPLLFIAGEDDHIIPSSLNRTNYRKYLRSGSVVEFKEFPLRAHYIIGQSGWEAVADFVLDWIEKLIPSPASHASL